MPAAITDKFNNATESTAPDPAALTAQKLTAATSITVDTTAGWATSTAVHFVIYRVDASGAKVVGSQIDCKGIVTSSTTIGSIEYKAGTDGTFAVGSKVICTPTAAWADDLTTGILTSLSPDGTVKDGVVTSASLATGAGEPGGAWTSWTPSYSGITVGNGTADAKYKQIDKTVFFRFSLVFGTTTTFGSNPTITFPVTTITYPGSSARNCIGKVVYYDNSVNPYLGELRWETTTTMTLRVSLVSGTYLQSNSVSATVPFTFGNTDEIYLEGMVEAA